MLTLKPMLDPNSEAGLCLARREVKETTIVTGAVCVLQKGHAGRHTHRPPPVSERVDRDEYGLETGRTPLPVSDYEGWD